MNDAVPVVSVEDVTKQYAGTPAPVLRGMSFDQQEGEFLALVGPSGCGKTTLLRSIAGLLAVDSGRVLHRGVEVSGPPEWLSIVFQDYSRSLFPWLTVRQNVEFGLKHMVKTERRTAARDALELVGLGHAHELYPWQLSGGMQQRCALARSIAASPGLLLLDEPFASVDAQTRIDLQDMVLRIKKELKLSMLLVTHDVDEAVYMADRIVVLSTRPSCAVEEITVPLSHPRDQLATKESPEFLELRHHVFTSVRREAKSPAPSAIEG
ncbi:ATP-binding cassette domain-containing protein [Microbacterium sp. MEC084]|uniref:ABC transporter ATP-binding protein n=1 Tax=Microbacterium sp. MEC084 TaxID=1963027 RepID=UPI00106F266E|nr:ABC transporter ATP-binding protein [Microbacterium sp. MEC084]MCD1269945.1 ATP-binding cassette domain-containing protein [Microbacterium sp. MEC084]